MAKDDFMAKVTVLVEGYARKTEKCYEATCSTVLIEDNNKKILVDPGCNETLLIKALAAKGLGTASIDYIFPAKPEKILFAMLSIFT